MQFKPKNREWVKNAAILFLAVLLVLTFFSNTIMNRTLPEVATQTVTSGTVTAKVRGTGTVVANGSHQVKADGEREIRSVMVKAGQEVQAGDVLFVLGAGSADDLDAAQEQLRQLQLDYQKAAISAPSFNYTGDERKIKAAKDAYDAAVEARDAALRIIPEKDQEAITTTEAALKEAQEELIRVQKEAARQEEEAMQEVDRLNAELERIMGELKELEQPGYSTDPVVPEETEPPEMGKEASPEPTANVAAVPEATESPAPSEMPEDEPSPSPTDGPSMASARNSGPLIASSLLWRGGKAVAVSLAADNSEQIRKLTEQLKDIEAKLVKANATYRDVCAAREDQLEVYETRVNDLQSKLDILTASPQMIKYKEAQALVDQTQAAYYDLLDSLQKQQEADGKSQALAGLDMQNISQQIDRQEEKIEELSGGTGNQVVANVSGIVESVECSAGDLMLEGDVLCTIEVPDMGYTLSFSVTNDQARRLSPGDTASVSNYYWGSQIDATLSTIRVDPKNPQTNKLLTFDLEGDVNAGAELTLSVGQRSAGYDTIVPNSAIRSDTNGKFVLIIESRSSPLGNRYIARRVDVEVLASDDVNSAVTGDLTDWSYVITTSNAPVKNGDMVRMADT